MEEGISFTGYIGSGVIGAMISAFGLYIKAKLSKQPQPFETSSETTSTKLCDERHNKNDKEHENLFFRVAALERQNGRVEGELSQISADVSDIKHMLQEQKL
ncbi:MAG: hypothetical protein PF904_10845 [Kiritimatiellae bacterium]|jgi:hypothetical protein|nr:hypothetical protein [Kiritimatiellia bacterium]